MGLSGSPCEMDIGIAILLEVAESSGSEFQRSLLDAEEERSVEFDFVAFDFRHDDRQLVLGLFGQRTKRR